MAGVVNFRKDGNQIFACRDNGTPDIHVQSVGQKSSGLLSVVYSGEGGDKQFAYIPSTHSGFPSLYDLVSA
jgi:hypothetical protein